MIAVFLIFLLLQVLRSVLYLHFCPQPLHCSVHLHFLLQHFPVPVHYPGSHLRIRLEQSQIFFQLRLDNSYMRSIDNLYALSFFTIPLESVCFRSSSRTFSGFATVIRSLVAQQSTSTIFFFPPRPLVISSLTGSPEVAAAAPAVFPLLFLHLHQLLYKALSLYHHLHVQES